MRRTPLKRTPIRKQSRKMPKETRLPDEHADRLRKFWIIASMGICKATLESMKELAAIRGRKIDSRNKFNRIRSQLLGGIKGRDCIACGCPASHRHHLISLSQGGTNSKENIAAVCHSCHAVVHPHLGESQ